MFIIYTNDFKSNKDPAKNKGSFIQIVKTLYFQGKHTVILPFKYNLFINFFIDLLQYFLNITQFCIPFPQIHR